MEMPAGPVLTRRTADNLDEQLGEGLGIAVTQLECDLADCEVGGFEKLHGLFHSRLKPVLAESDAHPVLEKPAEVFGAGFRDIKETGPQPQQLNMFEV